MRVTEMEPPETLLKSTERVLQRMEQTRSLKEDLDSELTPIVLQMAHKMEFKTISTVNHLVSYRRNSLCEVLRNFHTVHRIPHT